MTAAGTMAPPTVGPGPAEIKSIYSLPVTKGAGRTVAIVDAFDNPAAEKDLAAFRSAHKLSACTTSNGCFRKVNQRGGMSMLLADAGCFQFLRRAGSQRHYFALQKYYSHFGVAMVISSGDDGFTSASFPASWTDRIAVGGTTVTRTSAGWKHTAWSGAGSGCSAWIPKPSWQKRSALPDTDHLRYLNDHRSGLHDVVGGSNSCQQDCGGYYLCTALKGYDSPTGLGTPAGVSEL